MFKLVVLSAIFAVVAAAPSGLIAPLAYAAPSVHTSIPLTTFKKEVIPGKTLVEVQPRVAIVEQPIVTKVGEHVHSVPTAVSHQSSTIVHSKADIVTPVLAHGVQKTYVEAAPLVKTYHTPSIERTIAEPGHLHIEHAAAPLAYGHAYASTAHFAAPAHYASGYYAPTAYAGHYGAYAAPAHYANGWW